MKHFTLLITLVIAFAVGASAKEQQPSYNLSRALELFADEDYEKGVEYLKKEVAENPKCAKAYEMLAYYYGSNNENGNALSSVNLALKYTTKKDKKSRAYAHYIRGKIYLQLQDTVQAIPDYQQAIKLNPDDTDYSEELADLFFQMKRYTEASAIYNEMISKNPGYAFPLFGLARNAYNEDRFEDARTLYGRKNEASKRLEVGKWCNVLI